MQSSLATEDAAAIRHQSQLALDATPFAGLAVTTCHTGYNASVQFDDDHWSPTVFGTSASEAIAKALALRPVLPDVVAADVAPVSLAPPPY